MMLTRPIAIAFDLDGTLVDSAPDLCRALNRLLTEHRRPPVDIAELRHMVGDGAAMMIERGFRASGSIPGNRDELLGRFLDIYHAGIADLSRPFDGVAATLQRLTDAGIRLGVCTNKSTRGANQLLAALDLARYFRVVTGGDGPARKPHPDHLLGVVRGLGATPGQSLMVGDSANDVVAARAAGVRVVAVSFGYTITPARELGADITIDRFDELAALIGVG
jgi:phosphoglycolate phosphatase